ncbi:MAG: nitrous oxide-stimulated promoter family protein [Planctomycetes bacterium]|nr:nitrous oxide-stimulated promoter family protein [Planctomycetota bacterium]
MVSGKDAPGREKGTILAMVRIYCSGHHLQGGGELCADCQGLVDYAFARLDSCKFGGEKPVCSKCSVHCYKLEMREKIRIVMRYSGRRMALRHPVRAIGHLVRSLRKS